MYKNFLDKEIYVTKLNRIIFVDKNEYPEKKTDFGTIKLKQYKAWKICIETKNNEKMVGIDKWDKDGQQLGREIFREKQLAKTSIDNMGLSKLRVGT